MEVRRVVLSSLVVLAVAVAIGSKCPPSREGLPKGPSSTPSATQYVVIVPSEDGKGQCRIVPDPRKVENAPSITFVNLSDERIKIEVPAALAASPDPTPAFYLEKDESRLVPVAHARSGEYIYSIEGPTDGCLTVLPTPKIVIP
jgi:hypothetical protein